MNNSKRVADLSAKIKAHDSIHNQWNASNTVVHYFYYEGAKKKQLCLSVWATPEGIVVKTPPELTKYIDRPIQVVIADFKQYKHHKID